VSGNFQLDVYLELLQACIVEGQPALASRLLQQRAAGRLRLRPDDERKVRFSVPVALVSLIRAVCF